MFRYAKLRFLGSQIIYCRQSCQLAMRSRGARVLLDASLSKMPSIATASTKACRFGNFRAAIPAASTRLNVAPYDLPS
jgi:hypothetical protein